MDYHGYKICHDNGEYIVYFDDEFATFNNLQDAKDFADSL